MDGPCDVMVFSQDSRACNNPLFPCARGTARTSRRKLLVEDIVEDLAGWGEMGALHDVRFSAKYNFNHLSF